MAGNGSVKVKIDKVEKIYSGRNGDMVALNGVSLDIMENEFICSGRAFRLWKIHPAERDCRPFGADLRRRLCGRKGSERTRSGAGSCVPAVCIVSLADSA